MRIAKPLLFTALFAACAPAGEPLGAYDGQTTLDRPDSQPPATPPPDSRSDGPARTLASTASPLTFYDDADPYSACGDITWAGTCDGDAVVFCDGGELWAIDCAAHGGFCDYDGSAGWYDCVVPAAPAPAPPPSMCGGLGWEGECVGDVVEWCEGGLVEALDCAALGMMCDWDGSKGYFDCVELPPPPPSECDYLGYEGTCMGATATWCEADILHEVDCPWGCGWNPAGYFDCLPEPPPPPVDECDGITYEGACFGDELYWCEDGVLLGTTCAFGCAWNPYGYYDCL